MTSRYRVRIGILLIVALLQIAGSAQATDVTVLNPSFETEAVTNGNLGAATDWTTWSSEGGFIGTYNPLGYDAPDGDTTFGFYGASGDGTPQGADSDTVAWMYMAPSQYGAFQQTLDVTIQAGHTYTLTAAVGMVPGGGNIDALLWFGTEYLPDIVGGEGHLWERATVTPTTPGVFEEKTLTYTPTAADIAAYGGQNLVIGLCGSSTGADGRVAFDNVRVTDTVVPEPCSLFLLASGLVGLIAYAWRKRK